MKQESPRAGVGVMVFKDGKVLLGKRKGSHGGGEYASPGGHLEYMESFEDCARRETMEECGIEIENIRFLCVANIAGYTPKHYVQIGLMADWKSGVPQALEPEKCELWEWYECDDLPESMFETCRIAMDAYRTGRHYYDIPAAGDPQSPKPVA